MTKHLTPHGNSAALVIDKPILELLHIDMKTPLKLTTDGVNLIISPVKDASRESKFRSAMNRVIKKHHKIFSKLAK